MSIYFIDGYSKEEFHAGAKARNDITEIMTKNGYTPLQVYMGAKCRNRLIRWIKKMISWIKLPYNIDFIMQYPFSYSPIFYTFLRACKILKKVRFYFIIHDLESLRLIGDSAKDREKKFLRLAEGIISHNQKMTDFLVTMEISKDKIYNLQIFDYLLPKKIQDNRVNSNVVVFAGNLNKSHFCTRLKEIKDVQFKLFGIIKNSDLLTGENVKYMGFYPSNDIPYILDGSWSLIWDGDGLDTCSGSTGNYLRYNNPHKVSMSIVSRLPIIIWEEAAIADFIVKENIGFTIKNMHEIADKLAEITDKQYAEYQRNLSVVSKRLMEGFYMKNALLFIENITNGGGYNHYIKYSIFFHHETFKYKEAS